MYNVENERTLGAMLEIFSLHQARYEPSGRIDMSTSFNSADNQARAATPDTGDSSQHKNSVVKVGSNKAM